MIVTGLVLGAVLLSITGIIASFIPRRRVLALDESAIDTAAQLDAAIAIQRSIRIAELQRRMTDKNYWSYALLGLAFVMQIAALAVDHLTHPSIAAINILPAFFIVFTSRASRRKYVQRQLDTCLRSELSSRIT
jgi:hypothetical protein